MAKPTKREIRRALTALAKAGLSDEEIAAELEVVEKTIRNWRGGEVVPRRRAFRELTELAQRRGA